MVKDILHLLSCVQPNAIKTACKHYTIIPKLMGVRFKSCNRRTEQGTTRDQERLVLPLLDPTQPQSAHRLPRPCRTPARPSASARQPHRPPSPRTGGPSLRDGHRRRRRTVLNHRPTQTRCAYACAIRASVSETCPCMSAVKGNPTAS